MMEEVKNAVRTYRRNILIQTSQLRPEETAGRVKCCRQLEQHQQMQKLMRPIKLGK